ncbi:single-stranded DNA-binding protein [Azohydromonas aeria]|uniref:single-stranded DNA-binding protein n=1 Tax=Azohydromonas aeria TaxID=2590212 RepID=UPI0012F99CD5|nr:single-stranded DNA-binding protein [Azohydromonas aeria]
MIEGLIAGKVYGRPEQRTGKSGRGFVTAKVRAAAGDGEGVFINVLAFSESAQAALLALGDGDAVSLAGTLTPKAWTDKEGNARPALDLVAAQVLTTYHLKRKREAVAAAGEQHQQQRRDGPPPTWPQRTLAQADFPEDDTWLQGGCA